VEIELPDAAVLEGAVYSALDANGLHDDCHIRLIVSRGMRRTSGMDPRNVVSGPTIVVIPELKPVASDRTPQHLATVSVRRPSPSTLDPSIHHSNQLNSILARLAAYRAGADAALMLDTDGFVAEADTATVFAVSRGEVVTPPLGMFVRGITRGIVLQLARQLGYACEERRIPLAELYAASEAFLTGTICELAPVGWVDGRTIGNGAMGPICKQLLEAYHDVIRNEIDARGAHTETAALRGGRPEGGKGG
jgi:branched-chain amino acid aminotransferase